MVWDIVQGNSGRTAVRPYACHDPGYIAIQTALQTTPDIPSQGQHTAHDGDAVAAD